MVAEVMASDELTERLQQRRRSHEAAHAVVAWLMGGQVIAIGDGWCESWEPEFAMRAISTLAGPA